MARNHYVATLTVCAFSAIMLTNALSAQTPVPLYNPQTRHANFVSAQQPADSSGTSNGCTLVTFEGLADQAAIPQIQGINLPDWLSLIEESAGGSGNFSNPPSGVTIAFWLYGNPTSQNILIPNGASSVSLYYASYYPITLQAYDASGSLLNSVSGPANFDFGTYTYDVWSPLEVAAPNGKTIASLTVIGYANYTGIDNLSVCQAPPITSVEITQAIQQHQTLQDLESTLAATSEPPVPIIANKPAALRVYFGQVQDPVSVTVHLSGVTDQTKTIQVQPACYDTTPGASPDHLQRGGENGCQSMDFMFVPPPGAWTATLDVVGDSGNVLSEQVLNVKSRTTNPIQLHAVQICDSVDASGNWNCANPLSLLLHYYLFSEMAPTSSVTPDILWDVVREDFSAFANPANCNSIALYCQESAWVDRAVMDVNSLYQQVGQQGNAYGIYFGQAPPNLPGGELAGTFGKAIDIPSHAALSRTSILNPRGIPPGTSTMLLSPQAVEVNVEDIAHEAGHALGLYHTKNTQIPPILPNNWTGGPPGCYGPASAPPNTQWQFADNYVQSSAQREYGFSIFSIFGVPLFWHPLPFNTFDVMSYCIPRWVSPVDYTFLIPKLGGVAPSALNVEPQPNSSSRASTGEALASQVAGNRSSASAPGQAVALFWQVQGTIQNGTVQFDPLFQLSIAGNTSTENGSYSLVEQDSSGNVIFTRLFTPASAPPESIVVNSSAGPPTFSEVIPVNANVAALVVKDLNNVEIGRIALAGTAPMVRIISPAKGFAGTGIQTVSWTAQVSPQVTLTSKVLYSANGGNTWINLGDLRNATSLNVDFSRLPGTNQALIRVLVSDGIHTGSATSPAFTVPKKQPSAIIINTPTNNTVAKAADPVYLTGIGYDADDGVLTGTSLQWSSNLQGPLGSGSPLIVHLQPGSQIITLKGMDSDGNSITTTVDILVADQPPIVRLQTQSLDQAPTTCESATITVQPGAKGAPLSLAQYSINGGSSYNTIPLSNLPYKFIVPGSGFIQLIARAYDTSNQATVVGTSFLTQSPCETGQPVIQGSVVSKGLQAPGSYGVTITFKNIGTGLFKQATLNVTAQRLSGDGTVTYSGSNPISLPGLSPGQTVSIQLSFTVPNPNTVTRFSIKESGTLIDAFGTSAAFSTSQQVIP